MRRTAIVAALGLCTLGAVPASAAPTATVITEMVGHAERVIGACVWVLVAEETVTGGVDTYTGVAVGVAVTALEPVDVRCYVRVDGNTVDVVSDGPTALGMDVTAGKTTFTASDTQDIDLCMVFGLHAGIGPVCTETRTTQVPPQEVLDLLEVVHLADSNACPVLASFSPGVPGLLDIDWEGDVAVLGAEVHDCPPYGV